MKTALLKPYTIGIRREYYDDVDFLRVEETNAYRAEKLAPKEYKASCRRQQITLSEIYREYILEGHVNVLANYTCFGATDNYLKTV